MTDTKRAMDSLNEGLAYLREENNRLVKELRTERESGREVAEKMLALAGTREVLTARNAELVAALKACVDGTPDFYGIAQGLLDDLDAEAAGKQTAPAGEATRAAPADVKQHPVTAMGGESYGYDRLWNGSSWVSLAGAEAKGRLEAFAEALAQWPNLNRGCAENLFEGWLREKAAGKRSQSSSPRASPSRSSTQTLTPRPASPSRQSCCPMTWWSRLRWCRR